MDRLDVHILRLLYQGWPVYALRLGVRLPYRRIARQLGVPESTVRNRIEKFVASGLLKGTSVLVNPELIGLCMGAYGIEVSPTLNKRDVVKRLRRAKGVFAVQNHHSRFVGILFMYTTQELEQTLGRFNEIGGSPMGPFGRFLFPPCTLELRRRDWGLVLSLLAGDFGSYGQLAAKSGFTTRTLKRRMAEFVDSAVVFSIPLVSLEAVGNGVPADLVVIYKDRTLAEGQVLQIIDDFAIYAGTLIEGLGMYDLVLPTPVAASRILDRVNRIEGVKDARIEFVDEHFDQPEVLADCVREHIARLSGLEAHGGDGSKPADERALELRSVKR